MNFQGTLVTLAGAIMTFYLACAIVGRPDIPMKIVAELRVKSLQGTKTSWGCPSAFRKDACQNYNPRRYH